MAAQLSVRARSWLGAVYAHPFVYEKLRPLVLGRLDYAQIYAWLGDVGGQSVLDIGCGYGDALRYLRGFGSYHGFDVDARALQHLKRRHPDPRVHVHPEPLDEATLRRIRPDAGVAVGLLHHLSDGEASALLALLGEAPSLRRVITLDTVQVRGARLNNLIAYLDRGRHVRTPEQYVELVRGGPFAVAKQDLSLDRAGRRMAYYFSMCLERDRR